MPIASKNLWKNPKGKVVDEEPEHGTTLAVKGAQLNDADIKLNKIPEDAFTKEPPAPDPQPHIVISGPNGQAVVKGEELPQPKEVEEEDEEAEAKRREESPVEG